MFKGVVKILEELYPPGLPAHDFLWFMEVLEILVVSADTNGVFRT
jgi:hypothetical protein